MSALTEGQFSEITWTASTTVFSSLGTTLRLLTNISGEIQAHPCTALVGPRSQQTGDTEAQDAFEVSEILCLSGAFAFYR